MAQNRIEERHSGSREIRVSAADIDFSRPHPPDVNNGDETELPNLSVTPLLSTPPLQDPNLIGSYSKGLPHNTVGEVNKGAYATLLQALSSGDPADFERIHLGSPPNPAQLEPRRLVNPQSGLAFDLQGPDAQQDTLPAAPKFSSAEQAAEAAELYWMALLRDVPFTNYNSDPSASAAATSLDSEFTSFTGPKDSGGAVTPDVLFRGNLPGDLDGPYVSQFLLQGTEDNNQNRSSGMIGYGAQVINQRIFTAIPGFDFLDNPSQWLDSQNGQQPTNPIPPDATPRFIRNLRDLAIYVRADRNYQPYLNAALILMNVRHLAESVPDRNPIRVVGAGLLDGTDPGNPYRSSVNQEGFVTFGDWHVLALLAEVTTRALKAAWYQKFFVHRRLRPEEFGGRVHFHLAGTASYPINAELLNSLGTGGLAAFFPPGGPFFLPQAFPEGSPLHPAYPSGHAVVAGACVTILKAWFDDALPFLSTTGPALFTGIFEADPATNGTTLRPFTGPISTPLTIGGELNRLASNISLARNGAGLHWRSDFLQGVFLGERIAIGLLEEQRLTYNEPHSFALTRFDGTNITI